ncbi:MAG: bifunctional demethylmenaquinone methyltransferase/2-methoxy-6-polyprenyl-1,4-benzoquinol methylase UbiE [Pleurocapsa sp. SU_196_0]|nr:bifunctional demethylmenaquinone methyltransferase/2-methoxy-6-polyprenyl-1,4-benzoquinol methylase UbiE [Pleurocapsa sp. SU_196_0]
MRNAPPVGENPEKAQKVQAMFDSIAGRYDLLNRVLSMGVDRGWRVEATREVLADNPSDVLDVATGTGDFALTIKKLSPRTRVVGSDFAVKMLEIARQKAQTQNLEIPFEQGDALNLPYPDSSFDAVSCSFGFRNFADFRRGLQEFHRVLRPGGRCVILEFPPPPENLLGQVYNLYFRHVLPFIGGVISGRPEAYRYLPESVIAFPKPEVLRDLMLEVGFEARFKVLTAGLAAIHVGVKR